jgi:hypothetical protein
MVTSPLGKLLWQKFGNAPAAWLNSLEGKALVERSIAYLRAKEGDREADALVHLIGASACLSD